MKKRSASHAVLAALWVVMAMWSFATPCAATSMHKAEQQQTQAVPPCHQEPVANTPCDDMPIADCYDSNKQLHNTDITAEIAYLWLIPASDIIAFVDAPTPATPAITPTAQAPPPRYAFDKLIATSPRLRI